VRTKTIGWKSCCAVVVFCAASAASGQVSVLTANYDNNRTNSNTHETILNPQTVNSTSFGKLGTFPVDGQIYAQPLYVPGIKISGVARNVVYIATMHNSIYAIDADAPQSTKPLWTVNLGPPVLSSVFNFTDILPEVGILSTPVIDPARGVIYVVADTLQSGVPAFFLHALSLVDGTEQLNGPVQITASVPGNGAGTDGSGTVVLDPIFHLQRPGLALSNGQLYIMFGSHADSGYWHGWILGYDAGNVQNQTAVFNTTPNGAAGSIWQGGRGPVIDGEGDIYVVTGNGDYDGATAFSESILRLSPESRSFLGTTQLNIRGWFTPENWSDLNDSDWDLGSSGAMLIPGTSTLIAGSKAGLLFALSTNQMRRSRVWNTSQTVQANQWGMFDMALWNRDGSPIVYEAEPYNAVKALPMANGSLASTPSSQYNIPGSFFVGLAVSADGGKDGSGILWLTTGDTTVPETPGMLHAFDAGDLTNELWNSSWNADQDGLGRFAKFAAPTVVNGKVYVPTFSNALVIYGLLSGGPPPPSAPQISAVTNGASFIGGPVAPGEILAIFGANLGMSSLTTFQRDASGKLTTQLAGTQVLINGNPVPMYYVSASQIGAITPFSLTGPTAQIQVVYNGQASAPVTVLVADAAPGLFSADGNGAGIGIYNDGGTENYFTQPANDGSTVTFYATGLGQTTPPTLDGTITDSSSNATLLLPISVLANGQNVTVSYAGPAAGMAAGIFQIDIVVPLGMSGGELPVTLQAGNYTTPNFLWLYAQ
jgi:uncharacterized protein (TIGR03437 family)